MVAGQMVAMEQRAVRGGPRVLARMDEVQRRHFAGESTSQIAAALAVAEGTVRADLRRLALRWEAQIDADAVALRAALVAQLDDLKRRAIAVVGSDEGAERVPSRGQKTQALNVARQCVMDQARLLGLLAERADRPTPVPVRIYELEIDGHSEGS